MKKATAACVIIGGGIIGTSLAYNLAKAGQQVTLLDRAGIGCGTSSACDGFMFLQTKKPGISLEIALKSAELYTTLSEELDYEVHYRQDSGLILIETPEQLEIMRSIAAKQKALGLDVHLIDSDELFRKEPLVSRKLLGATYSPMDGHINPLAVTSGYMQAAQRLGATVHQGTEVIALHQEKDATLTVVTPHSEISAGCVINAAGAWAGAVGQMLGVKVPVIPRRGHVLVSEALEPDLFHSVMLCARYIAIKHNPDMVKGSDDPGLALGVGFGVEQTPAGNLLISNSRDFAGYTRQTEAAVLREIARYAVRFLPLLADIDIIRTYAGLRPYTEDGLPIMSAVQGLDNFYICAGHEGDGIAQAPVTGVLMTDYILKGEAEFSMNPFSLQRFSCQQADC